ncbi:MAG: hypothetical protein DYG92_07000 [Leptolyngbya sp. PLA1]|nr:hypothetical protein [Leptolyngbya sp. PLA1]
MGGCRLPIVLKAVLCVSVLGAVASAQPARPTELDPADFAARSVERLALLDLRATLPTLPESFGVTERLLGLVCELRPGDAGLYRRRAEAAWSAGEHELVIEHTRRVVELDPKDTVAQLRLITSRIGRLQTVGERLATYESLLGPRGRALDASIRSRLAVDAALLRRERGDDAGFLAALKQAVELDGTNKEAALLALTYFNSRVDDVMGRVELMANILYADPLDPRTHRMLRDELVEHGAYVGARRFHRMELLIADQIDNPEPEGHTLESFVFDWVESGPQKVADDLTLQLESRRAQVRTASDRDPGEVDPTLSLQRAQDVRLDLEYEQMRALASFAAGDKEQLARSMSDLALTAVNKALALNDVTRRPLGMSEADAFQRAIELVLELNLLRTLVGVGIEEIKPDFEAQVDALPATDPRRIDYNVWRAVRAQQWEEVLARAATQPSPTIWTKLAVGLANARLGRTAEAIDRLLTLAQQNALHPLGGYAFWYARELGGDPARAKVADELNRYAATIPQWLDSMISTPGVTHSLWVRVDKLDAAYGEAVEAQVQIKNLAPIPLALGSGKPLNSRLFFGPNLEIGVRSRSDDASGEVFDVDRRLRLMPNEEISERVWPETGLVGWLSEVASPNATRLRWRVFQGFETASTGQKMTGPGCLDATTGTLSRRPLDEARLATAALIARIAAADEKQVPAVLLAIRSKLFSGLPGGEPDPDAPKLVEALLAAYPKWSARSRLSAVAVLPPAGMAPAMAPFDAALRADDDPMVRQLVIASRVAAPDDPWLAEQRQSSAKPIASLANLQHARLQLATRTYAASGPLLFPKTPTGPAAAPAAQPAAPSK